jgi:hypothetical protein
MATGGYGQEAAYTIDPSQRSAAGHTIAGIARAAEEIEERNWSTNDGRDENQRRINDTIDRHERAQAVIQANARRHLIPASDTSDEDVQQWKDELRDQRLARWLSTVSKDQLKREFRTNPSSFPQGHPLISPSIFPQDINPISPGTPVLLPGHSVLPIPDPSALPIPGPSYNAQTR